MNASIEDDIASNIRISDMAGPSSATVPTPSAKQISGPSFGAPAKVEPFLLLAKSARGAGAAKLVEEATGASGVFVFGELLDVPSIKELAKNPQTAPHYALLTIFAYGSWQDYKEKASSLPTLKPSQVQKLKQLSLVTLASKSRMLPYELLMPALEIGTVHDLEDLIIESFYSDLLTGRLDQRLSRLSVDSVSGRDVDSLASIQQALAQWNARIGQAVNMLDDKIKNRRLVDAGNAQKQTNQSNNIKRVIYDIQNPAVKQTGGKNDQRSPVKARGGNSIDDGDYQGGKNNKDEMEVDEADGKRRSTRKRGRT